MTTTNSRTARAGNPAVLFLALAIVSTGVTNRTLFAYQDANGQPPEAGQQSDPPQQPSDSTGAAEAERRARQSELAKLRNRESRARRDVTIFSPLDLPTPSETRSAIGLPGPGYWQQQADYAIEVALDPESDSIRARETITYTNNSPTPLPYVWVNLEQNAFKTDSDGFKFTPPGSRFNNIENFEGGFSIEYVRVRGVEVPLHVFDTVGRIDLPAHVEPKGGTVEIEIAWSFNIPAYGADRMGILHVEQGKIYEMAQWFPSLCKFDDVSGWNTLPYLGQGEFYTDFGSFDVKITAPRNHVVCATGTLQNPDEVLTESQRERLSVAMTSDKTVIVRDAAEIGDPSAVLAGDGPLTWHFRADKVRTFAWTSSDATIWDAAGIKWNDGSTVLVQSVYPKEAVEAWSESTQMLRHSILHYSEKWFRYPYPTATNVSGICGGMEYPMIIFCADNTSKGGLHAVTSHEIGHTWFPMVVNTDERRHAWMDEGFNTFINFYDRFDDYNAAMNGAPLSDRGNRPPTGRGRGNTNLTYQPIALPADQLRPDRLGRLAYGKPGSGLRLLREVIIGPERFDAAFRLYIKEWAFKSPQPADFFRCMENAAGMNLAWFWRGWFLEDTICDQAIASVNASPNLGRTRIQIANKQEMVMPVFLRIEFDDSTTKDVALPVYVWYYTNLWSTDVPTDGKIVKKVTLDPNRNIPDSDRSNNVWTNTAADKAEDKSDTGSEKGDD